MLPLSNKILTSGYPPSQTTAYQVYCYGGRPYAQLLTHLFYGSKLYRIEAYFLAYSNFKETHQLVWLILLKVSFIVQNSESNLFVVVVASAKALIMVG